MILACFFEKLNSKIRRCFKKTDIDLLYILKENTDK